MTGAVVAVFAMPEHGHFQRLRPLIADLAARGCSVHVFTDRRYRRDVAAAGGHFVDVFESYPLERADPSSRPVPARYVSFAAAYADPIAQDVRRLGASLVVYDSFAVIGRVVAGLLSLPHVNVCAGHNMEPARARADLAADQPVSLSDQCLRAVEVLRDDYGMEDASPFAYVGPPSPYLNLYCEPPAYLTEDERRAFEPLAFYGSLPSAEDAEARLASAGQGWFGEPGEGPRVYACLGAVVWRYWPDQVVEVLATVAEAVAGIPGARGLVSLALADPPPGAAAAVARPGVTVVDQVDQWKVLGEADVFFGHHGLNSTHEALYHALPMVGYPFFGDQPGLARRCRELGVSVPAVQERRGRLTVGTARAAILEAAAMPRSPGSPLALAREREIETVAGRDAVMDRIAEIVSGGTAAASAPAPAGSPRRAGSPWRAPPPRV